MNICKSLQPDATHRVGRVWLSEQCRVVVVANRVCLQLPPCLSGDLIKSIQTSCVFKRITAIANTSAVSCLPSNKNETLLNTHCVTTEHFEVSASLSTQHSLRCLNICARARGGDLGLSDCLRKVCKVRVHLGHVRRSGQRRRQPLATRTHRRRLGRRVDRFAQRRARSEYRCAWASSSL
jgi:hypothetical protein